MGPIIGIDLGTTNSCVAILEGDRPVVIHNREGAHVTPSMVAYTTSEQVLVGTLAKRQAIANAKNTVYSVKRLIGRKFASDEVQRLKPTSAYEIVPSQNGDAWVKVHDRLFSPPEISARVLEEMKTIVEDYIGKKVEDAIITVPAHFNEAQRQATKDAGKIAKLNVRRILNEPTAAALAYGLQKSKDELLAVFDLGGGTFDVSILQVTSGAFEVLATAGDSMLGGDDFDSRLVDYLVEHVERESGANLASDPTALRRLKEVAEEAKKELSHTTTTNLSVPFLTQFQGRPVHLDLEGLRRDSFEGLVQQELARLRAPCRDALESAKVSVNQISRVLLVGGMTRMPAVQSLAEEIFQQKPRKDVNPDQVVAMGAAVQGAIISGTRQDTVLMDVTPHSLGIKVVDGRFSPVIERNSRIPCRAVKFFAPVERGQNFVRLEVYQGESEKVANNQFLGEFMLSGIPEPEGEREARIQVTFNIDVDGLVGVTALEPTTGSKASVEIRPSGGLTAQQIESIIGTPSGGAAVKKL